MPVDGPLFAVELLLAAFAGGALGAAIGALPSLGLAGVLITVGEVTGLGGGSAATSSSGALAGGTVTQLVGYGAGFGPHVAFAGGAAATAYAARKGYLNTDFEYHEAKHVTMSLGTKPDVLVVGGVFGVVGHLLARALLEFDVPVEPVMASIVVSALVHRLVLGYPLLGRLNGGVLDMGPFEAGHRRQPERGGGGSNRLLVEPWLPHQYEWTNVAVLGLVAGLFGAFVAVATGSHLLAFGIATTAVLFLAFGQQWMPVVYHMVLPASIAALALPSAEPTVALLVGGVVGVFAGLVGELSQRIFYAHADTHLDPPAMAILVTSVLMALLEAGDVFVTLPYPTLVIA